MSKLWTELTTWSQIFNFQQTVKRVADFEFRFSLVRVLHKISYQLFQAFYHEEIRILISYNL